MHTCRLGRIWDFFELLEMEHLYDRPLHLHPHSSLCPIKKSRIVYFVRPPVCLYVRMSRPSDVTVFSFSANQSSEHSRPLRTDQPTDRPTNTFNPIFVMLRILWPPPSPPRCQKCENSGKLWKKQGTPGEALGTLYYRFSARGAPWAP